MNEICDYALDEFKGKPCDRDERGREKDRLSVSSRFLLSFGAKFCLRKARALVEPMSNRVVRGSRMATWQ